jgi:hypothetical protein
MEDRKSVSSPTSDDGPVQGKADDFDPPESSGGPEVEDRPRPPSSYDIDATSPPPPSDGAKK